LVLKNRKKKEGKGRKYVEKYLVCRGEGKMEKYL